MPLPQNVAPTLRAMLYKRAAAAAQSVRRRLIANATYATRAREEGVYIRRAFTDPTMDDARGTDGRTRTPRKTHN